MRRVLVLSCLLFSFVALGVSSAGAAPRSWASPQIQAVVDAGLMAPSPAEFRPDDPLTAGELSIVLATLGVPVVSVTDLDRPVSVRELDAQLVTAIGFRDYARNLRLAALAAGLTPKQWLGTETVARLLGLRVNHVKTQEQLELQLGQPATRAEAAYSIARVLTISEFELEAARAQLEVFTFPQLDAWQQAILARALRFVGSPYVWAGTSERPQVLLGRKQPGGFDCSGFVWRVYKLESFGGSEALGAVLEGTDDVRHERRGSAIGAHPVGEPPAGRSRLLRLARQGVEAGRGRAHGDLRRERLDGPLVRPRYDAHADDRLVRDALRVGPTPPRRSRAVLDLRRAFRAASPRARRVSARRVRAVP